MQSRNSVLTLALQSRTAYRCRLQSRKPSIEQKQLMDAGSAEQKSMEFEEFAESSSGRRAKHGVPGEFCINLCMCVFFFMCVCRRFALA